MDELDHGSHRADGGKVILDDYATQWLEGKRAEVRRSTFRAYKTHVRLYITSQGFSISKLRLRTLNLSTLKRFRTELATPERKLSPKTINSILVTLGGILEQARIDGIISINPMRDLKKLQVPHQEMDFLRPEEIPVVLQAADTMSPQFSMAVLLSIFCGLRRSELLALRYEDLDCHREDPNLRVRRTYQGRGAFGEPKTAKSRRLVSLSPYTVKRVAEYRLRMGNPPGEALLFDRGDGMPIDPDSLSRGSWKRLLRRAGLRESLRWHDLRHTFASLLGAKNEPLKVISSLLGHASVQITADRYLHLLPGSCQAAASRLDKTVFGDPVDNSLSTKEASS